MWTLLQNFENKLCIAILFASHYINSHKPADLRRIFSSFRYKYTLHLSDSSTFSGKAQTFHPDCTLPVLLS